MLSTSSSGEDDDAQSNIPSIGDSLEPDQNDWLEEELKGNNDLRVPKTQFSEDTVNGEILSNLFGSAKDEDSKVKQKWVIPKATNSQIEEAEANDAKGEKHARTPTAMRTVRATDLMEQEDQ